MKKLIASLIAGAIFIGVGVGVFFMEIAEFSSTDYFAYIKEDNIKTFTFEDDSIFTENTDEEVVINVYLGEYFRQYGGYKIVDSPSTEGIEISIDYRGSRPLFNFSDYSGNDSTVYSLHCYQSTPMPKEILDAVKYICQNKVIVRNSDMFIVENVTIKTCNPHLLKIEK